MHIQSDSYSEVALAKNKADNFATSTLSDCSTFVQLFIPTTASLSSILTSVMTNLRLHTCKHVTQQPGAWCLPCTAEL